MTYIVSLVDYGLISSVLKKYNMVAFKYLAFNIIPQLRRGIFQGERLEENKYFLELPFDDLFKKVYGTVGIIYTINGNKIDFEINNEDLFFELYRRICPIVNGVPVINDKAQFKVNMYSRGIYTK